MAKRLSQFTQNDIDQLTQENPMSEEAAVLEAPEKPALQDTLEIEGRMKSGDGAYAVRLRLALRGDDLTNPEFAVSLPALLQNLGVTPIVEVAPVAAPRASASAPSSTSGQPAASGAGCPVHGTQYEKPGFRGQGYECKAYAAQKQDWSADAWVSQKDPADVRFYCKSKWK